MKQIFILIFVALNIDSFSSDEDWYPTNQEVLLLEFGGEKLDIVCNKCSFKKDTILLEVELKNTTDEVIYLPVTYYQTVAHKDDIDLLHFYPYMKKANAIFFTKTLDSMETGGVSIDSGWPSGPPDSVFKLPSICKIKPKESIVQNIKLLCDGVDSLTNIEDYHLIYKVLLYDKETLENIVSLNNTDLNEILVDPPFNFDFSLEYIYNMPEEKKLINSPAFYEVNNTQIKMKPLIWYLLEEKAQGELKYIKLR